MRDSPMDEPFAYAHPNGAIWRADNYPAGMDFSREDWFPLYRHARSTDAETTDAMRLVVAYDDLLRSYEGPSDTLFSGDVAEIDAAYDKMVAAVRAVLDGSSPVRGGGAVDAK